MGAVCKVCLDNMVQEDNGALSPDDPTEPSEGIIWKIIEFFHVKAVEFGCDAGEFVNIHRALPSFYKRNFGRTGPCKVNKDGTAEGSPTNSIMVN